jgi:hypothetical protein
MQRITRAIVACLGIFVALGPVSARVAPTPGPPLLPESACKATPVDAAHLFIVAGVMEGDTLTNLQLEDPNGLTTLVRVRVKPGKQRLTVLLQSNTPVIWDFEGAKNRVQRAIVVSGIRDQRVAVRGLPKERAEFLELARCRQQILPPWLVSVERRDQALTAYFGRVADRVAFEGEPNSLTLPDATFAVSSKTTRPGVVIAPRAEAEQDLFTYHPGGFREIEANSLVSPVPVLAPETFPSQAGLIQLERAGAIRAPRRDEAAAFVEAISQRYRSKLSPDYRMNVNVDYVITRDLMLPPGLHGAYAKNFLVLPGVAPPRGNAGHGCVYGMIGLTVSEPRCTAGGQIAIPFLDSVDLNADLTACRLIEPTPDAALEAIAIYDPSSRRRPGEGAAAPIVVRVQKPGDIFLVLNDLGPVVWRIQPAGGTRIVGVLLTGHYTSSVEGIERATPVVSIDNETRVRPPVPDPMCAPFLNYIGAAYTGGPLALALDAQVKAFTGRRLDGFRGAYGLKEIEIH